MRKLLSRPLYDPLRGITSLAAAAVALAHVPVIGEHLEEAPYMGVLFALLTAGCTILAVVLVLSDAVAVYAAAAAICALAIVGYVATRIVAFPDLSDDVGNWLEPLGVVSIVAEAVVVGTAWRAIGRAEPRVRAARVARPPA